MEAAAVKVLIIGYGHAGKRHAANAEALGHEVVVHDPPLGREPAWEADAAVVASPPWLHFTESLELLAKGIPALVEKPFCLPHQLEATRLAVDAAHVPVMVGHNLFWSDDWHRFREGMPGVPAVYRATFAYDLRRQLGERVDSYQRHVDQGGGVLLDCVQDIALALDVVGPVTRVQGLHGRLGDVTEDADDCADLCGRSDSGRTFVSWHFDYLNRVRIRRHEAWGGDWSRVWDELPDPESYRRMLDAFLTWVRTGREPSVTSTGSAPDPFGALEVVRAIG